MSEDAKREEEIVEEPYEEPAVISEEVFETLAVACGKSGGMPCVIGGGINS
jgi:hypothetical protein